MKSIEPSRNRDPNMTQIEHVYAICCRLEVDDDVISGKDVHAFRYYACVNLRVAILSSFDKIQISQLCNA